MVLSRLGRDRRVVQQSCELDIHAMEGGGEEVGTHGAFVERGRRVNNRANFSPRIFIGHVGTFNLRPLNAAAGLHALL
jgi:hypothetical protein